MYWVQMTLTSWMKKNTEMSRRGVQKKFVFYAHSQSTRIIDPPIPDTRAFGRLDRSLHGSERLGVGEGGFKTQSQEESGKQIHELQRLSISHQKAEDVTNETGEGVITKELATFIWMVEFTEENNLSHEIWFNKLKYVYVKGKLKYRRKLTKSELENYNK